MEALSQAKHGMQLDIWRTRIVCGQCRGSVESPDSELKYERTKVENWGDGGGGGESSLWTG